MRVSTSIVTLAVFCALLSSVFAQDLLVSSLNKYRAVSSDDGTTTTVDISEGPADTGFVYGGVSNMGVPGINRADNSMWMSFSNDHKVYRTTGGSLADGLDLEHVVGGDSVGTDALLGGVGTNALLDTPTAIAGDSKGNMYIVDSSNNVIRKVDTDLTVTTFVGSGSASYADGVGTDASFTFATSIGMYFTPSVAADGPAIAHGYIGGTVTGGALISDTKNNKLYAADATSIRKIDLDTAKTETVVGGGSTLGLSERDIAGDISAYEGIGTSVDVTNLVGLALDPADDTSNTLYFATTTHVGVVDMSSGAASVIAGNPASSVTAAEDGTGTDAIFYNVVGMTLNKDGDVVVVDQCSNGNVIRKVTTNGAVSPLSGSYATAGCLESVSLGLTAEATVDTRDSVTTIGDKDGDASTSTFRMEGRGVLAVQHLCDQFFPIGETVEADLSGCTSTIGGNIFELNVDSNTEVTIAEVTIVQNGVTVSNGSTVAVQGTSLTVQGLLSILDGATFSVDNGDVVVDSLDIVDGLSTYKLVVSKNSPNVISVLNNANLNGRLVICITYDYSFGVGHKFNALNFDTFAGQFSEILFVKLLARRSASRSLLEAAGVDVTCSSTDKACVATGVDAEDDDELVPYIAAIIVLGVLIAGVVVGTVMYAAKKKSDGNVAEMANAPAYGYDSSSYFGTDASSSLPSSSSSSTYSF